MIEDLKSHETILTEDELEEFLECSSTGLRYEGLRYIEIGAGRVFDPACSLTTEY